MQQFWRGFRAVVPLWIGMVPFGLAYAVTARSANLSMTEVQLMSLIVFSGSAQFSAAGLFLIGTSGLAVVATTFVINVRHLLYSLTLGQKMKPSWLQRVVGAYFLTDEAFGVTVASTQSTFAYLLGAELGVFVAWNLSTLAGILLSSTVPDPTALGLDFIFPVAFLALLIPLLKKRLDVLIALASGVAAFVLANALNVNGGLTILLVGIFGSLLGAFLTRGVKVTEDSSVTP
jgi:4-azaleucine resistance transporter AzlC